MRSNCFILLFVCVFSTQLNSQRIAQRERGTEEEINFYQITSKNEELVKKRPNGKATISRIVIKNYKHFERWRFYWEARVDSIGHLPNSAQGFYNAGIIDSQGRLIEQKSRLTANTPFWQQIGPTKLPVPNGYSNPPQKGRLNTFYRFLNPNDATKNVLFVGSPGGGIWKSIDNGQTWQPKLDQLAALGVTDIVATSSDANSPGTIYVSMGDWEGGDLNSIGVYKSTDFGETYQATGLTFNLNQAENTSNLIVYPDGTIIVGTNRNIKRSVNGGSSWTDVYTSQQTDKFGRFSSNGNNIVCVDVYGGVYLSKNKGANWSQLQAPGTTGNEGVSTFDPTSGLFYIQKTDGKIYSVNPNLTTPNLVAVGVAPVDYDSQNGFNQALVVKNGLILSGSVDAAHSSNNGVSWYKSLNGYWSSGDPGVYVHSDHHKLGYLDNGFSFYSCNDGGLTFINYDSKSDQTPNVQYKSEGVNNTQIYTVAITPQNDEYYMIGNQDNDGLSREMHNGKLDWVSVSAGDGTCTAIDYSNPKIRYLGGTGGLLIRTTTGFSNNYLATELKTPGGARFIWPLQMHSTNPNILIGGFNEVYKSTDKGDNWTNLNSGVGQVYNLTSYGNSIIASGSKLIKMSNNGGSTWVEVIKPVKGAVITSLEFNQSKTSIIYATIGAYQAGKKVYKSIDGGATWTNLTGNLPNVVVNQVRLYQNQTEEILYLGTEIGVYEKRGNKDWVKMGSGLPNVIVNDIDINYTAKKLVVATYGRGLWQITLDNLVSNVENDLKVNSIEIKQNPIKNNLLEFLHDLDENYNYLVFNTVGGVVSSGEICKGKKSIDLSNALHGIYILDLVDKNGRKSSIKFVIE